MPETENLEIKIKELENRISDLFRSHIPFDGGNRLNREDTQVEVLKTLKNIASNKDSGKKTPSASFDASASKIFSKNTENAASSLDDFSKSIKNQEKVEKESTEQFLRRTQAVNYSFGLLSKKVQDTSGIFSKWKNNWEAQRSLENKIQKSTEIIQGNFANIINNMSKVFFGSAIADGLKDFSRYLNENISMYRKFSEYGASFGGSILQMQTAATEARMPLESLYRAVERNSYAIANMGGPRVFGGLSKVVRDNFEKFGQFGMEIDQVNERLGDYLETERQLGSGRSKSTKELTEEFTSLVDNTDRLSKATGKRREEILKDVNEFKRTIEVYGVLRSIPPTVSKEVEKVLTKTAAIFSAIPGETGKQLLSTIPTAMTLGTSLYTEIGKDLNAFAPNLRVALDRISQFTKVGDVAGAEEAQLRLIESAKATAQNASEMSRLTIYAQTGNQQARNTLKIIQEMAAVDTGRLKEEMRQRKEYQNTTNLMLNFQNIMQKITGWFRTGFLKGFEPIASELSKFFSPTKVEEFGKKIEHFGKTVGQLLGRLFNPTTMERIGKGLVEFGEILKTTVEVIGNIISAITSGISSIYDFFRNIFDPTGATIATVAFTAALVSGAKLAFSGIPALFKSLVINRINRMLEEVNKNKPGAVGRVAGRVGVAGAIAGAGMLAGSLIDREKPGMSTVGSMLEYGSLGASIGMLVGPWGAAIGAAAGAAFGGILANWESITSWLGDIASGAAYTMNQIVLWFKNKTLQISDKEYELESRALKIQRDQIEESKKQQKALQDNTKQLQKSTETQYKGAEVFLKTYTDSAGKEQQVLVTLEEFGKVLLEKDPLKQLELFESMRKSPEQKARSEYFVSGGVSKEVTPAIGGLKSLTDEQAREIAAAQIAKEEAEKRRLAEIAAGSVDVKKTGINLAEKAVLSSRESMLPIASRVVTPEEQAVQQYASQFKATGAAPVDFIKNAQDILKQLDSDIRSSWKESDKQELIKKDQAARLAFKQLINEMTEQASGLSYSEILDSLLKEKILDDELRLRTVESGIYRLIRQNPAKIIPEILKRMEKLKPEELEQLKMLKVPSEAVPVPTTEPTVETAPEKISLGIKPEQPAKPLVMQPQPTTTNIAMNQPDIITEESSSDLLGGAAGDTLGVSKKAGGLTGLVSILTDPKESLNYILENTSLGQSIKDNIQGALAGGTAGTLVGGPFGAAVGTISGGLLGKDALDTASNELSNLISGSIDYFFGKTVENIKEPLTSYAQVPDEDLGVVTDKILEKEEALVSPEVSETIVKPDTVLLMEQIVELMKEMKNQLQDLNESSKYLQAEIVTNTKETARQIKDNPALIAQAPLGSP